MRREFNSILQQKNNCNRFRSIHEEVGGHRVGHEEPLQPLTSYFGRVDSFCVDLDGRMVLGGSHTCGVPTSAPLVDIDLTRTYIYILSPFASRVSHAQTDSTVVR